MTSAQADTDSGPVVLCVDDEANVLASLARFLRRLGCHPLIADGAEQALELLRDCHVQVLITDEAMPGMCGVELLRKAKTIQPDCVRIMLTGHVGEQDVVLAAVNEGEVFRLLPKPWLDDELRDAVVDAVGMDPKRWAERKRRIEARLVSSAQRTRDTEDQQSDVENT